MRNVRKDL